VAGRDGGCNGRWKKTGIGRERDVEARRDLVDVRKTPGEPYDD
jgi:hypothetical protein